VSIKRFHLKGGLRMNLKKLSFWRRTTKGVKRRHNIFKHLFCHNFEKKLFSQFNFVPPFSLFMSLNFDSLLAIKPTLLSIQICRLRQTEKNCKKKEMGIRQTEGKEGISKENNLRKKI
jgi:hypothetical protein